MNSNPEIVEISSDSSSESTGLNNYRPPMVGYRTKEQARKKKHDVNASNELPPPLNIKRTSVSDSSSSDLSSCPSYVSSYHYEEEQPEVQGPSKGKSVMTFKGTSSAPALTHPPPNPGKQILGVANQHVWNKIKERGIHKTMPDFKGKGKRTMKYLF
jgi:hypothetical protein